MESIFTISKQQAAYVEMLTYEINGHANLMLRCSEAGDEKGMSYQTRLHNDKHMEKEMAVQQLVTTHVPEEVRRRICSLYVDFITPALIVHVRDAEVCVKEGCGHEAAGVPGAV